MKLFDLHCDTAYRMRVETLPFCDSRLQVNAGALSLFSEVVQVFALWSDPADTDEEAWLHLCEEMRQVKSRTTACQHLTPLFSVEDARCVCADLSRIPALADAGVCMLGPCWSGDNPLGSSHDSTPDRGLTHFGRAVIRLCFACGIIPDIAHASRRTADEILSLGEAEGRPVCCSHTAFAAICPHTRCITDEEALRVAALGGVVGISMVPAFLGGDKTEDIIAQYAHAEHLGISHAVALGCDFDGTRSLPRSVSGIKDLPALYQTILSSQTLACRADDFFWGNARRFFDGRMPHIRLPGQPQ